MHHNNIKQENQKGLASILATKVKEAGLVCLLGLTACSAAPVSQPITNLPPKYEGSVVASLEPVVELSEKMPTSRLLEMGQVSYQAQNYEKSIDFFIRAIDTQRLNNTDRATSYWHLGMAYHKIGDYPSGCNAFDSFITVAKEIIEERDEICFVKPENDFTEYFELHKKMRFAQIVLNATWAKKAPYFGRSLENPVPVQGPEDIEYFVRFANGCPHEPNGMIEELREGLYRVVLKCDAEEFNDEFYFKLDPED